jgi:hypothetical protein
MYPIKKSMTIALAIKSGQVLFGDIATLREKKIVFIESYRDSNVSSTPYGQVPVDDNAINASYLTLAYKGTDRPIENLPLTDLIKADNQGTLQPFGHIVVDWVNSFVQCTDSAAVSANAGNYWLFRVQYEDGLIGEKC